MADPIESQVGPQGPNNDGTLQVARGGKFGDTIVSSLMPPQYEQAYRGNKFFVSNQALVTTTVGLATTYTGLCVSNPITSIKNLVISKVSMMQSVIQSANVEAFALAVGFNANTNVTHTTPVTIQSSKFGSGAASVAFADISATLPTAPVYEKFMQNTGSATTNGGGGVFNVDGGLILVPGAYLCFVTPAQASVAGMWFNATWIEVPV